MADGRRSGASISVTRVEKVLTLKVNRPQRLNAIPPDVVVDLADEIEAVADDADIRVAVLRGEGKAFCSGADITGGDELPPDPAAPLDAAQRWITAITLSWKPVVAAVHGPAVGIGVAIALAADITIAVRRSYTMQAFTKIGLMPDGGASALVATAAGRVVAGRFALMAERLFGERAAPLGLIATAVDDVDVELKQVVSTFRSGAPEALARTKHDVNVAALDRLADTFAIERAGQPELVEKPDFAEGMAAFAERRAPVFGASVS
jgi:enoyl-CoA hydratase